MFSLAPSKVFSLSNLRMMPTNCMRIKYSRLIIAILISFFLMVLTSPTLPHVWQFSSSGLEQTSLPGSLRRIDPIIQSDLDGDGVREHLELNEGQAYISKGNNTVWQSSPDWNVTQAALTDLNHDGKSEATLLVWREFRPWPVDAWLPYGGRIASFHDSQNQSCHIILIGWSRGAYRELWAGSALADPILSFAAADLDGDTVQELVTLEGSYADHQSGVAHTLKIWRWNSFGFDAITSIEGSFSELWLSQNSDGLIFILTP